MLAAAPPRRDAGLRLLALAADARPRRSRSTPPAPRSCEVRGFAHRPRSQGHQRPERAARRRADHRPSGAADRASTATTRPASSSTSSASKDGWLLIRNGSDGGLKLDAAHAADGRGWISAPGWSALQLRVPRLPLGAAARRARGRAVDGRELGAGQRHGRVGRCMAARAATSRSPRRRSDGKPVRGWSYQAVLAAAHDLRWRRHRVGCIEGGNAC